MTDQDHCAENAMAERVNGILKQEYGLGVQFRTKARRPHTSLDLRVPDQVHQFGLN